MGFIASSDTVYATAYLTEKGREYLFNKNNIRFDSSGNDLFQISTFGLGDPDVNYKTAVLLESGEIPDISGKSEESLKTATNYVQKNLIVFTGTISQLASSTTSVTYNTNLNNDSVTINIDAITGTATTTGGGTSTNSGNSGF